MTAWCFFSLRLCSIHSIGWAKLFRKSRVRRRRRLFADIWLLFTCGNHLKWRCLKCNGCQIVAGCFWRANLRKVVPSACSLSADKAEKTKAITSMAEERRACFRWHIHAHTKEVCVCIEVGHETSSAFFFIYRKTWRYLAIDTVK